MRDIRVTVPLLVALLVAALPATTLAAGHVETVTTIVVEQNPMKPIFLPHLTATVSAVGGAELPSGTLSISLDPDGQVATKVVAGDDGTMSAFVECCHFYGDYPFTATYLSDDGLSTSTATVTLVMADLDGPLTNIDADGWYIHQDVSIDFSTEEDATSECRLDGEAWQPCISPWTRTVTDGHHTLDVVSTDTHGNAGSARSADFIVDTTAPTGTFTIKGGEQATNDPLVPITVDGTDNLQPIWRVYVSMVPTLENGLLRPPNGSWSHDLAVSGKGTFTIDLTSPYLGGVDGDGPKTVYLQFQSGVIGQLSDVVSRTIQLDRSTPVIGTVGLSLSSIAPTSDAIPYSLSWTSSDVGTGVAGHQIQRRFNGGPWTSLAGLVTGTSATVLATAGMPTDFRVRAVDRGGGTSAWSSIATVRPTLIQDGSSRVSYHGRWSFVRSPSALGGWRRATGSRGASATVKFTGREFVWVGTRSPNRGRAKVYVDGVLRTTVNARATSFGARRVLYSKRWTTPGSHTVRIVALDSGSSRMIDVDAFVVVP